MLSLTPRAGAGGRYRARALAVSLALAASLAAADLSPSPGPRREGAASAAHSLPAAADPDAALQRLAAETERIKPSAPDAVARLKSVVQELIAMERAQGREIAALRAGPSLQSAAPTPHRRSRRKSAPAKSVAAPEAGTLSPADEAPDASGAPAVAAAPVASGALFGKRGLKKVHRPGCVFGERIKAEDRVYFKSMQEATTAGYEACKICRPDR